jgi:hypothetical protein
MDNTSMYIRSVKNRSFLLFFGLLLLSACMATKPSATKSAKKYFETFYVGEEGTQYFIKPLVFASEASPTEMMIDMTFRYKDEIKDSVLVHISLEGPDLHKSISKLQFKQGEQEVQASSIALMFNENTKKGFKSRFSAQLSLQEVYQLFQSDQWVVQLEEAGESLYFSPTKKSSKVIRALNNEIFILM